VKLDEQGRIDGLLQAGVSDYLARFLTRLELKAAEDVENVTSDDVQKMTGHAPKTFKQFAEDNKAVWMSG
jgi:hypothetical protein